MSWEDDCHAKGGFVTVFPPRDPYTDVAGEPACRLPDPSNPSYPWRYVYMESIAERAARLYDESSDQLAIAMGNLVQFRDSAITAITGGLGTVVKWGAIGIAAYVLLFLLPRKRS